MERSHKPSLLGFMVLAGLSLVISSCATRDIARLDSRVDNLEKKVGRTLGSASNCDFSLIDARLSGGTSPKVLLGKPKVDVCKHLLNEVAWVSVERGFTISIKVEDPPGTTPKPFPSLDCTVSHGRICLSGPVDPNAQEDPLPTYPNDPPDGHYFKYTVCLKDSQGQ